MTWNGLPRLDHASVAVSLHCRTTRVPSSGSVNHRYLAQPTLSVLKWCLNRILSRQCTGRDDLKTLSVKCQNIRYQGLRDGMKGIRVRSLIVTFPIPLTVQYRMNRYQGRVYLETDFVQDQWSKVCPVVHVNLTGKTRHRDRCWTGL